MEPSLLEKGQKLFLEHGGMLRSSQAIRLGLNPRVLYAMRDQKLIQEVTRGVYRLCNIGRLENGGFAIIGLKIPQGVICLLSALAYYDLTDEIPSKIHVALKKGAEKPRLVYPALRCFWFSETSFETGIETHVIDNVMVRIYSPEKTLADCMKFRNKIGKDLVIGTLKCWRERRRKHMDTLIEYARICRVENVMRLYLEVLL